MLLSSLVIQRTLGFCSLPDSGRKPARTKARKVNVDERCLIEFMVFYFEGFRGLRWFVLSFFFLVAGVLGGVVDSPQSIMSFLSFVRKPAILF